MMSTAVFPSRQEPGVCASAAGARATHPGLCERFGFLILGLVSLLAGGCTTQHGEGWGTRPEYHALVSPEWKLDSKSTPPKWPLYVVGMEKLSRKIAPDVLMHRIEGDPNQPCLDGDLDCLRLSRAPEEMASEIRKVIDDDKVQWPTHITRIQGDGSSCVLYSIYPGSPRACGTRPYAPGKLAGVWDAFEQLDAALAQNIEESRRRGKPVSHIVLLVTGWNTFQDESAKNFSDWALSLGNAGPAEFNPIYVAISWQSTWGNMEGTGGAALAALSFANKSNDADEIGFTWANQLLNRYLMRTAVANDLPVLVIAHSFGARIAAGALHGGTLLRDLDAGSATTPVTLVALQPAFSSDRLRSGGNEAFYTEALPPIPGSQSLFTASAYDDATERGNAFLGSLGKKPYISSPQVVREMNSGQLPDYLDHVEVWKAICSAEDCAGIDSVRLIPPTDRPCARIPLIDATPIITQGDGVSGAHSDVYDDAAAQLIFRAVEACAH
jgi:hypothetical protein